MVALALLTAGLCANAAFADAVNRIVLRVNDQIATLHEYEVRRDDSIKDVMRREKDPEKIRKQLSQIPEVVFRNMFEELLLNSRADQLSIEENEQALDGAEAQMRESTGLKSDQEFQQALAQSGMTEKDFREMLRRQMRQRDVMSKELASRVKVKDEDLRRYYRENTDRFKVPEQVQLREVVVLDDSGLAADAQEKLAADIRAAVAAGKALGEVVQPSLPKTQTSKVVDFGWVSPGDLDKTLEAAAWKLPNGGVSEAVRGRGGLHLLQVVDRHPAHVQAFSEVQAAIQQREQERRYQEESTKYMNELEQRALIVADPPAEAANFRHKTVGEGGPASPADTAAAAAAQANAAAAAATSGPSDTLKKELVPATLPPKTSTLPPPRAVDTTPVPTTPPPNPPPPPPQQ